jgi:hypothetical protein
LLDLTPSKHINLQSPYKILGSWRKSPDCWCSCSRLQASSWNFRFVRLGNEFYEYLLEKPIGLRLLCDCLLAPEFVALCFSL